MWRWTRRNPWTAGLSFTTLAELLVTVIGLSIAYTWTSWALTETKLAQKAESHALDLERQARSLERESFGKARRHFSLARGAVDRYLQHVTHEPRLRSHGLQPLRRDLLKQAARFYRELILVEGGDDPQLQLDRAASLRNLGMISLGIGSRTEAARHVQEGLAIVTKLVADYPQARLYPFELAAQRIELARIRIEESKHGEAIDLCRQSIDCIKSDPSREAQERIASAHAIVAHIYTTQLKTKESLAEIQKSIAILEKLAQGNADQNVQVTLAESRLKLGRIYLVARNDESAKRVLTSCRDTISKAFPKRDLQNWGLQRIFSLLAQTHHQLSILQRDDPQNSLTEVNRAKEIWDELLLIHPLNQSYRGHRAAAGLRLADLYIKERDHKLAGPVLETALADIRYLDNKNRDFNSTMTAAYACSTMAQVHTLAGDYDKSLQWYSQAIDQLEAMKKPPKQHAVMYAVSKIDSYLGRAQLFEKLRRHTEAARDFERAGKVNQTKRVRPRGFDLTCRCRYYINMARTVNYRKAAKEAKDELGKLKSAILKFNLACVYSIASETAKSDPAITASSRQLIVESFQRVAMKFLGDADKAGAFKIPQGVAALRTEPSLAALREHKLFKELLGKVGGSAQR